MPLYHQIVQAESESIDFFYFFLKMHKPSRQLLYISLGPWKQFHTKGELALLPCSVVDSILFSFKCVLLRG